MIKPLFGTDVTENKDNEQVNGDELIVAKTSEAYTDALDNASEKAYDISVKSTSLLSHYKVIIALVAVAMMLSVAISVMRMLEEDIPVLHIALIALVAACVMCFALSAFLLFVLRRKQKKAESSDEAVANNAEIQRLTGTIFAQLGVPAYAEEVDILCFSYKIKNDKTVCADEEYCNLSYRAFADRQNLYLADTEGKYAVPLSSVTDLVTVKRRIQCMFWNKDEKYSEGRFKPYKIRETKLVSYSMKAYGVLHFSHGGETWGIYFPEYELTIFERLTGKIAVEGNE